METNDRTITEASGYLHPTYANCFAEWGRTVKLPLSRSWLISRSIPGTGHYDAMGCYPIFCCEQWSRLKADLENLQGHVCIHLVTDPFGDYDAGLLHACFPDLAVPFKEHFVTDLAEAPCSFVSQHHRRNVAAALRSVVVARCDDPTEHADEWIGLYRCLVNRHGIRGLTAFSDRSLRSQLQVPGLEMFRASVRGEVAGMILWMVQDEIAYYHLGAYNDTGYREHASFALFWATLEWFAQRKLRWLSLGAGAGLKAGPNGLTRFKEGWATGRKVSYLCGRIFDRQAYTELAARYGPTSATYFPVYRRNDFG
jgi:hypothetical protein